MSRLLNERHLPFEHKRRQVYRIWGRQRQHSCRNILMYCSIAIKLAISMPIRAPSGYHA